MPTYAEEGVDRERATKACGLPVWQAELIRRNREKADITLRKVQAETAKMQKEFSERFRS